MDPRRAFNANLFPLGKESGGPYWTLPELSLSKTRRKGIPGPFPAMGRVRDLQKAYTATI